MTIFLSSILPRPIRGRVDCRALWLSPAPNGATRALDQRHPENTYYHAFSPRFGIAYSLTPKTVLRSGYGIFFSQAFYPGWNGGIAQDGFNTTPTLSSSLGGLSPAMMLSEGFPSNLPTPVISHNIPERAGWHRFIVPPMPTACLIPNSGTLRWSIRSPTTSHSVRHTWPTKALACCLMFTDQCAEPIATLDGTAIV